MGGQGEIQNKWMIYLVEYPMKEGMNKARVYGTMSGLSTREDPCFAVAVDLFKLALL